MYTLYAWPYSFSITLFLVFSIVSLVSKVICVEAPPKSMAPTVFF